MTEFVQGEVERGVYTAFLDLMEAGGSYPVTRDEILEAIENGVARAIAPTSKRDIDRLATAAKRAAEKLKTEYDRLGHDAGDTQIPPDECWAEGEALWAALKPFDQTEDQTLKAAGRTL